MPIQSRRAIPSTIGSVGNWVAVTIGPIESALIRKKRPFLCAAFLLISFRSDGWHTLPVRQLRDPDMVVDSATLIPINKDFSCLSSVAS